MHTQILLYRSLTRATLLPLRHVRWSSDSAALRTRRILSAIQPTGALHLGNYLGSVKNWVDLQGQRAEPGDDRLFALADLHALTMPKDPKVLRDDIRQMAAALLACGIDPAKSTLFRQSSVPEHTQLNWIIQCLMPMGWLNRMTQWKSKFLAKKGAAATKANGDASLNAFDIADSRLCLGLFAYPSLQAADIILYQATHVPVGEDQQQHLELTRYTAALLNKTVKQDLFPSPQTIFTPTKRVMSLRHPDKKMSKSDPTPMACIFLTDSPEEVLRKVRKAVTDSISVPSFDPANRPGVSNLVTIYAALANKTTDQVCQMYQESTTQVFKQELADVIIETLRPIQANLQRIERDPHYLDQVLNAGAQKAREIAHTNYQQFAQLMGL
ncbi:Tryptophan--tRNA ligase, mitochondrial [Dimargaris verticillata]|uniref:Tryptophan--tRNA ligase, mitochondrial n=1 Tax=Dimargaris verticillata TaxID=2761393 RepID=A0A9W8AY15_9FUNG|nr:Tryptophan--tRNA ligase, mitochondrial [Dimargaris verticillata]